MNLKFFILFSFYILVTYSQESAKISELDSVEYYINKSKAESSKSKDRLKYAFRAKALSQKYQSDSLLVKSYLNLASLYSNNDYDIQHDKALFVKYSHYALSLSKRINNLPLIAISNQSLGYYYFDKYVDSAYYYNSNAEKLYRNLKDNFKIAVVLYDTAILQRNDKDYIGSELTCINALSLLDGLDETKDVIRYRALYYSVLGLNSRNLEQYEKSVEYHKKGIELSKKIFGNSDKKLNPIRNNLGNTFRSAGQYNLAIDNYNEILNNENLAAEDPDMYTTVLDNYAYTLFLSNDYSKLPELYLEALKICDSLNLNYNSVAINKHLAEYYQSIGKKDSALHYAYQFKSISEKYYKDDLLNALRILSRLEHDSIAIKHYESYVKLSDSLLKNERAIRNKFARIQYETDQYIEETKRLGTQNILISIIAAIFILSLGLLYFIKLQKGKNQRLLFEKEQQDANQEIYGLMLRQQAKLEEGRMQERHRIAEDLHDGILSQLLGTRMNLGFLDLKGDKDTLEDYNRFLNEIQKIEKDIRLLSHELKGDDTLTKTNFESIIDHYLKTQSLVGHFKYEIINKGVLFDNINDFTKVNIYRILQEAIQNVIKHAKAHHVWITFYLEKEQLNFIIEDNGVGFDINSDKKGIGLKNIASRVEKLKGSLKIDSIPNKKTLIHIIVPV